MNQTLHEHMKYIVNRAISAVQPDGAVRKALCGREFTGRIVLVSVGKAAWQMAATAEACLGGKIDSGIVITKYGHAKGPIADFEICEAGHPIPDENSFTATEKAIALVSGLKKNDTVLFLLSGGGSALFEKPLIKGEELFDITDQLLACGAEITQINTVRKRLSAVKGGRFARLCEPAQVYSIVLSDIIGDPLDMIASGPAYPDSSTSKESERIMEKYKLRLSKEAAELMKEETVKSLENVTTVITGSVREFVRAAAEAAADLGYEPIILTDRLCCEAREAGSFLASILKSHEKEKKSLAFIAGGETVVTLTGTGKGGRNQEIALAAAAGIAGMENAAVFSVGSDGTDGPTDAAGGYVDGDTAERLRVSGLDIYAVLRSNDAYHALERTGGLIFTGPTGTNVNDVAVALLNPPLHKFIMK